ncbi:Heavy metal-associated isoprenylated plant protein 37, partial [Linum perenne]
LPLSQSQCVRNVQSYESPIIFHYHHPTLLLPLPLLPSLSLVHSSLISFISFPIRGQKHVLKVNVDCEGCQKKVWKLLKKIEGVYSIDINAEAQEVTVSGTVLSGTLIKMLNKAGKYAEVCFPKMQLQTTHVSDKQNMLPVSIGDEVEVLNDSSGYQNIEMGSAGTNHADLMAVARIGDSYRDEDRFMIGWNSNAASNRPQGGYHGTDHSSFAFSGMPANEVNHQQLMASINNHQGLYRYFPSADTNNGYVGNKSGNNDTRFSVYRPEMMNYAPSLYRPHAAPMTSIDYNLAAGQQPYRYIWYQ